MPSFAPGLVAWVTGVAVGLGPGLPLVSRTQAPAVVVWPADGKTSRSEADAGAVGDAGFEAIPFARVAGEVEAARSRRREAERQQLEAVRAGLDRAEDKSGDQDWAGMVAELLALEQGTLALLSAPANCRSLWEVEFRHGLALHWGGDASAAAERFRFAVALDSSRRPDAKVYGPDIAQAFLAAAEAQRADVKEPVGLEVEPADGLVIVDCKPVDADTVRLAPGLHVLRVEAPAHPAVAAVIDTRKQRAASVAAPRATDASGAEALGQFEPAAPVRIEGATWSRAVANAAADAGADGYVWLTRDGGRFAAQVVADRKRGRRRLADSRVEAIALALEDLSPQGRIAMGKPVVDPPTSTAPDPTDPSPKKGIARKWWFWTIIGGVVATSLGLGLGLPDDGPSRLRVFGS